jgi:hypothetical protein
LSSQPFRSPASCPTVRVSWPTAVLGRFLSISWSIDGSPLLHDVKKHAREQLQNMHALSVE